MDETFSRPPMTRARLALLLALAACRIDHTVAELTEGSSAATSDGTTDAPAPTGGASLHLQRPLAPPVPRDTR